MLSLYADFNPPRFGLYVNKPLPPPFAEETSHRDEKPDAFGHFLRGLPRKTLAVALALLPIVALLNLGVLVWSLGGIDLSATIVAPGYLVIAFALVFVPIIANSLRLAVWARFLEVDLPLLAALRVMTGTVVANSVTPTTVGGMPLKILFLMGEGVETRKAVTMLSLQTAEDMLVLFSLVGLSAWLSGFLLTDFLAAHPDLMGRIELLISSAAWFGFVAVLVIVGSCLAIGFGMLGPKLQKRAKHALDVLRQSISTIAKDWIAVASRGKTYALINIGLAVVQWTVRFSIAGLVIAAFGIDWHPQLYWLLQYLVQALSSVVPTPGAAGGAEAAFLLLFSPFVELDTLLPAMSTWRLLHFFIPLGAAALAFFFLRRARWRLTGPNVPFVQGTSDSRVPAE